MWLDLPDLTDLNQALTCHSTGARDHPMNRKIYFKFNRGKVGDPFNPAIGWLAVGPHAVQADGANILSIECHDLEDVQANAKRLKQAIDAAVSMARRKFSQSV